ncbi:hypothetical protein [Paenibacillus sp. MSJ-34]|uniref:hypothetical protein n=1 Tax=Paenibacillus sp. MSJ-34 TaxID=2841529 RepID=UPI001C114030|nr:hypothetical protein [Paenibacillus sp. MSJ-34]MBU5443623.1 hypothetical protein [Paenibacillus sp. MSJ-34]
MPPGRTREYSNLAQIRLIRPVFVSASAAVSAPVSAPVFAEDFAAASAEDFAAVSATIGAEDFAIIDAADRCQPVSARVNEQCPPLHGRSVRQGLSQFIPA